jgi:hypothetical protein
MVYPTMLSNLCLKRVAGVILYVNTLAEYLRFSFYNNSGQRDRACLADSTPSASHSWN